MKVTITYCDTDSLTVEEVVQQARNSYGDMVEVNIQPDSCMAYDQIYFGLQQLLTHKQSSLLYEKNTNYHIEIQKLRASVLGSVTELIDQVIIDNEARIGGS